MKRTRLVYLINVLVHDIAFVLKVCKFSKFLYFSSFCGRCDLYMIQLLSRNLFVQFVFGINFSLKKYSDMNKYSCQITEKGLI